MSIKEKVRSFVTDSLLLSETELGKLNDETKFWGDLVASELDMHELIIGVEVEFSIAISNEERDSIKTYGQLVSLVERKIRNK